MYTTASIPKLPDIYINSFVSNLSLIHSLMNITYTLMGFFNHHFRTFLLCGVWCLDGRLCKQVLTV